MAPNLNVKIVREVKVHFYPFIDYFQGFEDVETVKQIFGEKTKEVLSNLKVEFTGGRGYMGVSDADGHLFISARYMREGDLVDLYLDVIHELVHVKQFMEGRELFDTDFTYVERPTEVEAYRRAVQEARKLGLSEERICDYLRTEWMSDNDVRRLMKSMNVNCSCLEEEKGS